MVYAMSFQDAYHALDIDPDARFDLQKKYRDASRKNHPDLGGSTEKMQLVNEAYEFLKKGLKSGGGKDPRWQTPEERREERIRRDKEYERRLDLVDALWKKAFDPHRYETYFKQWVTEPLTHKFSSRRGSFAAGSLIHEHEWVTADRGTVFWMDMWVQGYDIQLAGLLGGGAPGMEFKYSTDNFLYHNKRKQKMKQQTWDHKGHSHDVVDPTKLFPAAVLKKVFAGKKQRKFMARDFREGLRKMMHAEVSYDDACVPLDGEFKLLLKRTVFMRQASWMINGIYEKYKRVHHPGPGKYLSIFETEESLHDVVELVKQLKHGDLNRKKSTLDHGITHIKARQHAQHGATG